MLAALCAAWAVFRTRRRGPPAVALGGRPEAEEAGLRAALAWLAFPPLLITASTGTTDVLLAAMLAVAVLLWRRPALCAGMLAIAGWFKLAPFALVPVSLAPLRGRRLVRALAAIALVSLPMLGCSWRSAACTGRRTMLHADVLPVLARLASSRCGARSGSSGLQPLAQGCVLGLIAGGGGEAAARAARSLHDRLRMAALSRRS